MSQDSAIPEGARIFTICNACRYCEGYCAVFPAMEHRRVFTPADLNYLANLCHDCGECFYACQYAPPHEFAVNLPKTMAQIRIESYRRYAWPAPVARALERNTIFLLALLALFLILLFAFVGRLSEAPRSGDFYLVISHRAMVIMFGAAALAVSVLLSMGFRRFWRETGAGKTPEWPVLRKAFRDAFTLEYLRSGGTECTYPGEHHSGARRWFHHATFYGFLLCFASTSVAAFYDNILGWKAPYGYLSLPVVLGTLGGLGLLAGPARLLVLKRQRDPAPTESRQATLDIAFLLLLFFTSLTGLLLLVLRETRAMAPMLVVHLGIVMALFLTMPYGKFVHAVFRIGALIRYSQEHPSATDIRR